MVAVDSMKQIATLHDFTHFHGMLCHPRTAARCIDAFTGAVLFMPNDYYSPSSPNSLCQYDYSTGLNVASYYLLVFLSFTGLSTWLGRTKFLVARDETETTNHSQVLLLTTATTTTTTTTLPIRAECTHNCHQEEQQLIIDDSVVQHIQSQFPDSTELTVRRRFEFDFFGPSLLSVIMIHLSCNQGRLHLVEVYRVHNPVVRGVFRVAKWIEQKLFRRRQLQPQQGPFHQDIKSE